MPASRALRNTKRSSDAAIAAFSRSMLKEELNHLQGLSRGVGVSVTEMDFV